ncbi:hypothetical protein CN689_24295 [Peribacillus butanolivorans]|uniref:Resolvase/invertase-type recombinase catalytic domain-containing protein n=1 Tax=Peribacillus butanolivorans TaxID=421767 RepID=A0AAX0RVE4_9BACI|nr:recombinase family protein [Peribacillus butanolivorans]PEJ27234.1 hypothetical protein CN689_24295 [Peribacillus butanolivorans]
MIFGYSRVSSSDQNLDQQKQELQNYGCEHIVEEEKSVLDRRNMKNW